MRQFDLFIHARFTAAQIDENENATSSLPLFLPLGKVPDADWMRLNEPLRQRRLLLMMICLHTFAFDLSSHINPPVPFGWRHIILPLSLRCLAPLALFARAFKRFCSSSI